MTAWLWFPAALVVGSFTLAAILIVLAPKPPRVTPPTDDHMRVAVESSPSLMHEFIVAEFNRELDQRIADGLRDWGRGDVA